MENGIPDIPAQCDDTYGELVSSTREESRLVAAGLRYNNPHVFAEGYPHEERVPPAFLIDARPEWTDEDKPTNPKDQVSAVKVWMDTVPDTVRVACAMAFTEGALKYGKHNWRVAGVRASVYKSAFDHHFIAWWNGKDMDDDSGLPHLWKALACLAILIDAEECGKLTDDRPPAVDMDAMMDDLKPIIAALKAKHADKNPRHYTIADSE